MGVFNQHCLLSGKTITKNEEALVFILKPSKWDRVKNGPLVAASLPILGKYDEYGGLEGDLSNHGDAFNALNKILKNKKNRFDNKFTKLNIKDPEANFWGSLFDFEVPVCYISKKLYDQLPELLLTKSDILKIRSECIDFRKRKSESKNLGKMSKELKKTFKSMSKLLDSEFSLQGTRLGRLCSYERYYLEYEGLKDALLQNKDEDILKFYALTQLFDSLGRGFYSANYGTQDNNKKIMKKFHELVLKTFKS